MDVTLDVRKISQLALERDLKRKRDLSNALEVSPTMLGAFLNSRDPLKRNARSLIQVLRRQPDELLQPIDKYKLQEWMALRRIPTEKALAHEMGISPSSLSMMFEPVNPDEENPDKVFDPVKQVARKLAGFFNAELKDVLVFSDALPEEFEEMLKY
jgi:hypothetical protein